MQSDGKKKSHYNQLDREMDPRTNAQHSNDGCIKTKLNTPLKECISLR